MSIKRIFCNHIQVAHIVLVALFAMLTTGAKAQEPHATGVENDVVYLNDLDDHRWTYFSGVNADVDGGNFAAYTSNNNYPVVNMKSGLIRYALYGGGYGSTAIVTGNPQVMMTGGTVGFTETVAGNEVVHGNVFGGGNVAPVSGNTNVVITAGEVKHNVYGGGNQAPVSGTSTVLIGESN